MKRSLITMKLLGMLGTPPLVKRYSEDSQTEISELSDSAHLPEDLFETFLCDSESGDPCCSLPSLLAPYNASVVMHSA